jgi:hypothetical protein
MLGKMISLVEKNKCNLKLSRIKICQIFSKKNIMEALERFLVQTKRKSGATVQIGKGFLSSYFQGQIFFEIKIWMFMSLIVAQSISN